MSSMTNSFNERVSRRRQGSNSNRAGRDLIRNLKNLTMEMQRKIEALDQVPTPAIEPGFDFYDEVSRFEIELIKQALKLAKGHQTKAAQMLNLKATTLNVIIKRYNIPIEQLLEPNNLKPEPSPTPPRQAQLQTGNLRRSHKRSSIKEANVSSALRNGQ